MPGDHRLGDAGAGRQFPDGLLAVAAEPFEQRPPRGVGEGTEQQVGGGLHVIYTRLTMGYPIAGGLWMSQVTTVICSLARVTPV